MKAFAKRFVSDERGLETVEYAVMTALIVAALVTAIGALSGAISGRFNSVKTTISGLN
jgi:Flp pilus assembly pilin Flp